MVCWHGRDPCFCKNDGNGRRGGGCEREPGAWNIASRTNKFKRIRPGGVLVDHCEDRDTNPFFLCSFSNISRATLRERLAALVPNLQFILQPCFAPLPDSSMLIHPSLLSILFKFMACWAGPYHWEGVGTAPCRNGFC